MPTFPTFEARILSLLGFSDWSLFVRGSSPLFPFRPCPISLIWAAKGSGLRWCSDHVREFIMESGPKIITTGTSPWALIIREVSHWCFTANSSYPHSNPMMQVLSCPVYKWVSWDSEEWRYLPTVTQPVPQELALERRAAWLISDRGAFHFLTQPHWVVIEKIKFLSQSKRDVYQLVETAPGLLCRDASETQMPAASIWEVGGTPCQTARHIFVTLRNQGNFLRLTKVKPFKALEDWKRE